MTELSLSADAERALREAENFCWRANVAIIAAEHLVAGALLVLGRAGNAAVPGEGALRDALLAVHGAGADALTDNVMWGSSAREALNTTAAAAGDSGATLIDAAAIAAGVLHSGELSPMFCAALNTTRQALLLAIADTRG